MRYFSLYMISEWKPYELAISFAIRKLCTFKIHNILFLLASLTNAKKSVQTTRQKSDSKEVYVDIHKKTTAKVCIFQKNVMYDKLVLVKRV